jgi:rod shape-determining protein MreD
MNVYLNNIGKFFGLFALQVLVISHLNLSYFINPYIHVLFLLTLPVAIPTAYLLIIGFISGLALDTFLDTTGLHAFASVLIAFIRPLVLRLLLPKGSIELVQQPGLYALGPMMFLNYITLHTCRYLLVYFLLEIFSLRQTGAILLKTILSTVVSVVLMLILSYLFSSNKKKRTA